jgi:GNAT superfamily N-acetyltransferase
MNLILNPYDFVQLRSNPGAAAKCAVVDILDGKVVGQLVYHEFAHLGDFYVDPAYQKMGIGTKLLNRMEQIVPEYFTFPSTDASKSFFLKRGLMKLNGLEVFRKEK